jgi:hypothetical protein
MEDSRTSSKKSMTKIIKHNLKLLDSGMSIDLLMIWLLTQLNPTEDLCGLVKIMMEMFNLISLLKVMDHLVS